jgi:hypothetical protein
MNCKKCGKHILQPNIAYGINPNAVYNCKADKEMVMTEPVKTPPNTSNDLGAISKENILKAVKATNLCFTHMKYHGQQSKECEVQERTVIEFAPKSKLGKSK